MKRQFSFDQTTLRYLYNHYRIFTMPTIIVVFGIFIIFLAIIPLIQDTLKARDQETVLKGKIELLQSNLGVLNRTKSGEFDQKYTIASQALPEGKDAATILNAVITAAIKASVELDDFRISLPKTASSSASALQLGSEHINVDVSLAKADVIGAKRFLQVLAKSLPLTDVSTVESAKDAEKQQIKIIFFFKPSVQYFLKSNEKLSALSTAEEEKINEVSSWDGATNVVSIPISTGSASRPPGSNPFQ